MSLEDDIDLLRRVPILQQLGRRALRIVAIGVESRDLEGGDLLFVAGDPADCAYVIARGSFSLQSEHDPIDSDGRVVRPPTILDEMALLTDMARPYTGVAREVSTVIRIPRSLFIKTLESQPEAAKRLRDGMAEKVSQTTRELRKVRRILDPDAQ
jgi:CRP-like cAMP-binding protein